MYECEERSSLIYCLKHYIVYLDFTLIELCFLRVME